MHLCYMHAAPDGRLRPGSGPGCGPGSGSGSGYGYGYGYGYWWRCLSQSRADWATSRQP
jgi:hypothetical protein